MWEVTWAHPKFGSLLASCSYDRRVLVHKETAGNTWSVVHTYEGHKSSVNGIAWAPHELGASLAAASADGSVSVMTHKGDASWETAIIQDCSAGVNSVSWAPYHHVGCQAGDQVVARLATAGVDGNVRVYKRVGSDGVWELDDNGLLKGYSASARDVAWAPSSGMPVNVMATAWENGVVVIWRQAASGGEWVKQELPAFSAPAWRVSWSTTGNLLAVSCGDNSATLWKETLAGGWEQVSDITPDGAAAPAAAAASE